MIQTELNKNKRKFPPIVTVLIIIALLALNGWLIYKNYQPEALNTQLPIVEQKEIRYIINKGEGNIKEYQLKISNDSTVFSLLEELSKKENFEIKTTVYAEMGILIDSIDGLKGGTNDKWWQYWVNNNLGELAADKKKINNGDIVEWKFEVIKF